MAAENLEISGKRKYFCDGLCPIWLWIRVSSSWLAWQLTRKGEVVRKSKSRFPVLEDVFQQYHRGLQRQKASVRWSQSSSKFLCLLYCMMLPGQNTVCTVFFTLFPATVLLLLLCYWDSCWKFNSTFLTLTVLLLANHYGEISKDA